MSSQTWRDAIETSPGPKVKKEYIVLYIKGFMMGIADLIPGVSGGTIAFITGIYENLLDAISSFNKDVITKLLKFQIKDALSQVHIRFLAALMMGIFTAIFSLARVMHYLMNEHPVPTWAAFFGLIGASIVVIWNQLENHSSPENIFWLSLGAIVAYVTVGLIPVTTPFDWWFIYLCGIIGITAMILPGLSGSFLLLILGKYEYITGAIKNPFVAENFITLVTFSLGSLTGLLAFTRVLNFFLKNYRNHTMAFLTGILIGSLRKVWPWKEVLSTKIIRGKVRVLEDANIIPQDFNSEFFIAIAFIILGFVGVLYLEKLGRGRKAS